MTKSVHSVYISQRKKTTTKNNKIQLNTLQYLKINTTSLHAEKYRIDIMKNFLFPKSKLGSFVTSVSTKDEDTISPTV